VHFAKSLESRTDAAETAPDFVKSSDTFASAVDHRHDFNFKQEVRIGQGRHTNKRAG
jgi:hypothetical protein